MPAPPQISAIKAETYYNSQRPNIPFKETYRAAGAATATYFYVIVYGGDISALSAAEASTALRGRAADRFIEHYYPNYYSLVTGAATADEQATLGPDYNSLRGAIESSLTALNIRAPSAPPPPLPGTTPVFSQSRVLFMTAHNLGAALLSPSPAFYTEMGIGSVSSTTSIKLATLPSVQSDVASFLSSFDEQARNLPGQLNLNVNFNALQGAVSKILQIMVRELTAYLKLEPSFRGFDSKDSLYIDFDDKNKIVMIRADVKSVGTDIRLMTGFITNTKYNNFFNDPLTLSTLKNYENITQDIEQGSQLGEQSSVIDFMQQAFSGAPGINNPVNFSGPHTPDNALGPHNNIFANRESEDLIDIKDISKIRKVFSTFKTSEEIRKIDNYANDPQVRKMALQNEKAKRINAAIAITDVVDKALKMEFPMAGLNDTPEGRAINQILNQFGIQELAKEALICLTAGVTVSLSRITEAVKQELMGMSATPLYTAPNNPINILERPSLGDFKVYFSITGDPPIGQQILDIILKALANGAFEIIKAIADMIKANCNKIFQADVGSMDAGAELASAMPLAEINIPTLPDIMNDIAEQNGLDPDGAATFNYLTDVSTILSPDELCKLFSSPSDVSPNTLEKIREFNLLYPHGAVSVKMVTYNAISNYFIGMAQYVDTTSICNKYIETVADRLKDCTICFDEGTLAQNPAIDELAEIIENGISIEIPEPDFMCPDSPTFIDNPVLNAVLPNLFYTLVETIQLQVGQSLESVRTSLLVPQMTTSPNAELSAAMAASGLSLPAYDDAQQGDGFDPSVLETIGDVFGKISETMEKMNDENICPDLDLSKIPALQQILDNITGIIAATEVGLNAAAEAGAEIEENLANITSGSGPPGLGSLPYTTYRFPKLYKAKFAEAVGPMYIRDDPMPGGATVTWRGLPGQPTVGASPRAYEIQSSTATWDVASYEYAGTTMTFNFDDDTDNEARIIWNPYGTLAGGIDGSVILHLGSHAGGVYFGSDIDSTYDYTPTNPHPTEYDYSDNLNPHIARFVSKLPLNYHTAHGTVTPMAPSDPPISLNTTLSDSGNAGVLFTQEWMRVLGRVYTYLLKNGAFSEYTISRLNFFKDNEGCDGPNVGDLLDAEGIVDQIQNEFKSSACQDAQSDAKLKIKNVIRYGVVNLLIQVFLIEFIMKNICVLSATNLQNGLQGHLATGLHPGGTLIPLLVEGITREFETFASSPAADVASSAEPSATLMGVVRTHFRTKLARATTIAAGGLVSPSGQIDIPTAGIDAAADLASFSNSQLIQFLVEERLMHTWGPSMNRSTLGAIDNVLDPRGTKPALRDVFYEKILGGVYPKAKIVEDPSSGLISFAEGYNLTPEDVIGGGVYITRAFTYDDYGYSGTRQTIPVFWALQCAQYGTSADWATFQNLYQNATKSFMLQYIPPTVSPGTTDPNWSNDPNEQRLVRPNGTPYAAASLLEYVAGYVGFAGTGPGGTWVENMTNALHGANYTLQYPRGIPIAIYETGYDLWSSLTGREEFIKFSAGLDWEATDNAAIAFFQSDPVSVEFMEQVYNPDLMFTIPLLHNMNLSDKYFPEVSRSMQTAKTAVVGLLNTINNSDQRPVPTPPTVANRLNAEAGNQGPDMEGMMREIILKFLRETPIQILKGLVEMIDPHIAITKMIRDITGMAFAKVSDGITMGLDGVLANPMDPAAGSMADAGVTGEDVLALAFCGLNVANSEISQHITPPAGAPDYEGPLLGPKFTLNGIDFTGTVAGMFMAPPSPLGIIYLLIMMLQNLAESIPPADDDPTQNLLPDPLINGPC